MRCLAAFASFFAIIAVSCASDPGSTDGREEQIAEVQEPTSCGITLSRYPVMGKHNNGYDSTAGNSSLWSCDDANSNSDFVGGDHLGNDIWAAEGTPVVATVDGTLLLTGWSNYSGNKVTIKDKCGWYHFYCHLKDIAPGVGNGVVVKAGDVLGSVGKTGTASNGVVHLHYSIYPDGNYDAGVDPWPALHSVEHNVCSASGPVSQPAAQGNVVAWGPNRLDAFARATDSQLFHGYWTGTEWGSEMLGGELTSDPVVAAWGPNRLDVFARGTNNELIHKPWDGTKWYDWEPLGGELTSNPAVVAWGPNRLDIFARGKNNDLMHMYWTGSAWGAWESLGGSLTSSPVAVAWGPNRLDIFARGSDNGLVHLAWTGTNWGEWDSLGGTLTSAPAVAAWGPDRLDIFARGKDNDLLHTYWAGGWGPWESLGGSLTSDPAVTAWASNRLDIFARGAQGQLVHKAWTGTMWGEWEDHGGSLDSDPSVVAWGPDRLDVFDRNTGGELEHFWWANAWGSFETLGGPIACSGDPAAVIDFRPAPPKPSTDGGSAGTGSGGTSGSTSKDGSTATGAKAGMGPKIDAGTSGDDGGCSTAPAPRPTPNGWLLIALASLIGVRRRSRPSAT